MPFQFEQANIDIDSSFTKKVNKKIENALGSFSKYVSLTSMPTSTPDKVIEKKLIYGGKQHKVKFCWVINDTVFYAKPYKFALNPENGTEFAKIFKDNSDLDVIVLSKLTIKPMVTDKVLLVPSKIKVLALLNIAVVKRGGKTILEEYVVGEPTESISLQLLPESVKQGVDNSAISTNKSAFRVELGALQYQISEAITNATDKAELKIKETFMTYKR